MVLAPAYPLMAGYQPDLKALGYQSGTMKAIQLEHPDCEHDFPPAVCEAAYRFLDQHLR